MILAKKIIFGAIAVINPIIIFLFSNLILNLLSSPTSNTIDELWEIRTYILLIFIFSSLVLILQLLKINFFSYKPYISYSLSHHHAEEIKSHELLFKNKSICTGCVGTSLGLIFSQVFIILFILFRKNLNESSQLFMVLGFFLIYVAYSRYIIEFKPVIRLFQHSLLPVGSIFLVLSVDILYESTLGLILMFFSTIAILANRNVLSLVFHSKKQNKNSK